MTFFVTPGDVIGLVACLVIAAIILWLCLRGLFKANRKDKYKLVPCPFCGKEAAFQRQVIPGAHHIVYCSACGSRHESSDPRIGGKSND